MKKFLVFSMLVFLLFLSFQGGFIKRISKYNSLYYFVRVEGKDILVKNDDNWSEIQLVGVNMNRGKPGAFPGDSLVKKNEYLRWLSYISDMNANCIRVNDLMDTVFYEAIAEFNKNRSNPLYLIQGISFNEVYLKDGYDPQSEEKIENFKEHMKLVVNAMHGNPYNNFTFNLFDSYSADISDYVLAYTIGIDWAAHDLIYSELINSKESYSGKYFYTNEKASSFESYLAEMADYLVTYETVNYGQQRLISMIGSLSLHTQKSTTSLSSNSTVLFDQAAEGDIKSFINVENIKTTKDFHTGLFVSYNIYPSYPALLHHDGSIESSLTQINKFHTIPVVVSEYGIPSARLATDFIGESEKPYITEKEQAAALLTTYQAIRDSNYAGSIISEWNDSWFRSAWNTKENIVLDRSAYWSDAQTYSQYFGLMAFDPGIKQSACYPDNSNSEWLETDIVSSVIDTSLSIKSDEKFLYFMIDLGSSCDPWAQDIFIDLDITPNSGSIKSAKYNLSFERDVDFIIHISGKDNSKMLVHEYYNTHSFLEQENDLKMRPDIIKHTKDMDLFSNILIYTQPKVYVESLGEFMEKRSTNTGRLVYGNANPKSDEFNSISDFYIGEDFVEIRIPWGLLNIADPSSKQIHDDYYHNFGIEKYPIKQIYAGYTIREQPQKFIKGQSGAFEWNKWEKPIYHERLKEAYYLLKEKWTAEK